jgi:predicted metal-dependent hydrolase
LKDTQLELGKISIDVLFKDIKNVHLSVYPPTGRVSISAPKRTNLDTLRVYAISKLDWIKQQQKKLQEQERETPREYLDSESHYLWGKRYLLKTVEDDIPPTIEVKNNKMILRVRPATPLKKRESIVSSWYREQVRKAAEPLIMKWEPIIGVKVNRLFVQQMKTNWGSCNHRSRNIRLNTELAKKPTDCFEYIIVHEMVHLLVDRHDDRFTNLMDKCFPHWRIVREKLNSTPLAPYRLD